MEHSRLAAHAFKKGRFTTPLNDLMNKLGREDSWYLGRLPEYLWLGLILDYHGRDVGLEKCNLILTRLTKLAPEMTNPSLSSVLALDPKIQTEFFDYIASVGAGEALCPLTCLFTYSHYPAFTKALIKPDISVEARISTLVQLLRQVSDHQSHLSTDIRFLVIYFELLSGKVIMPKEILLDVMEYPKHSHDDDKMRMLRPMIRAMEIGRPDGRNEQYLDSFWNAISRMGECELSYVKFTEPEPAAESYVEKVKAILKYYTELQVASDPLDNKMLVLLGIATYSYKRLLELVSHGLYHEISGRGIVRVLIEDYIMVKYLLKTESTRADIWSEFQSYGIGQYKLIVLRWRESGKDLSESHVAYKYLDLLINEYVGEEFRDMDTSYFDKQGIRQKAEDVGEKELYGLYYDYDSAFEHGLWGAIRESSLIKCDSPVHQYHCVPDVEDHQKLKSVWHDCVRIMNLTLSVLEDTYGLPSHLRIEGSHEK